jgi:hypothetical protein
LDQLASERGAPCYLRMDNGLEFVAHAIVDWCRFNGEGSLFIDPGASPGGGVQTRTPTDCCASTCRRDRPFQTLDRRPHENPTKP